MATRAPSWASALPHVQVLQIGLDMFDAQALATHRLDAQPGTMYLVRPDQHICARWRQPQEAVVHAALAQAIAAVTAPV